MVLDNCASILQHLPDSDCHPNIVYFPRRVFVAPRPSAKVVGDLLYQPASPEIIRAILPERTEKRIKRLTVLKAAKADEFSDIDWLPAVDLAVGQYFSVWRYPAMKVVCKVQDTRPCGGFWIVTNYADLKSFHTSQIKKVMAVKKETPPVNQPVILSIGKPITDLTPDDFRNGNLPTFEEASAAWNAGQIKAQQWKAIVDALSFHRNPAYFLDMVKVAGR